ncbi:hypothetical protein [Arthrobacter sp. NicSoilC12]|uniref:hypothetical protein n=1 Tax=Arthrobacter sp. NicSoilC12 TaxID=2831001 RepID=UPI001CC6D2CC|nr:hypothetical protein [Arthrobacter sp. NicSoilC12]GIU56689.1 hypothetical protein NicSoilC12_24380 [Arthrobacter sp. NicSoilC12]
MLLKEVGLIRARRGVGRFVADNLPRIGIGRIRPFEEVIGGPGQHIEIKRIQRQRQPASEFVAPGVEPGAYCWFWEFGTDPFGPAGEPGQRFRCRRAAGAG